MKLGEPTSMAAARVMPASDRLTYRPIIDRPTFAWPGDKKLAVYFAVCVEWFAYGPGKGIALSPGLSPPDTYNWAWREYGNRVGGFRLIDLFDAYRLPLTVLLNTDCYTHCPELVTAHRTRGDEIVAHGRTNAEHQNGLSEDEERALIREATAAIEAAEGRPPRGWMSPGAHPSARTEDLLAEAGYRYTLDWPVDDQPVWLRTQRGPLLSVPYPHEVNDVPMVVLHHGGAATFADMIVDQFDELLAQAAKQPLALGITLHTFIAGQPFRIRQLRRALDHLIARHEEVWFTTAGSIADHFAGQVAPGGDT